MTNNHATPVAIPAYVRESLPRQVQYALEEDVGTGDITALLIPENTPAFATLVTREDAVLCGTEWANEVFRQLGDRVSLNWLFQDGDRVTANTTLCELSGDARDILTGERTALNFLQTLSGTATTAWRFAQEADEHITILDTRKTLPGLRNAQKYAVRCGGCENHRIGLYDAFLIKENHIAACGSIENAITRARELAPDKKIIIEVETLNELQQAVACQPDQIMLDNFSDTMLQQALAIAQNIPLEISGNVDLAKLKTLKFDRQIYTSSGSLTKHVHAIDLSLRLSTEH